MFNMSSIVLDNSFKTSPFIDALVNKMSATDCFIQPLKQVSVGRRSQTGVASKFVYQLRHHRHVHRIDNCIEQLIVN